MASLFTFKKDPDKAIVMEAILNAEMKSWKKTKRGPQPTLEDVTAKYKKLPPAAALASYATKGRGDERLNAAPDAKEVFTSTEAEQLAVALLEVEAIQQKNKIKHPEMQVVGKDKKTYNLEPKELPGWLQASASARKVIPVEQWVKENNIGLTANASTLKNGKNEEFKIETHNKQRRVVGRGEVTEPLEGYYGGVVGTKVGDQDLLDIFISTDIYDQMEAGEEYKGPVFVMQQRRKDDTELKVGFAEDVDQFKRIMTSTWENPAEFEEKSEGRYVELSYKQYQQMKEMIAKNPSLTLEEFAEEKGLDLDKITRVPEASDPNAQFEQAMQRGAKGEQAPDDRIAPPPTPKPKTKAPQSKRQPTAR